MAHKILAIDDHPDTLTILVSTLRLHGYRVVSTRSPKFGVQLAEREKPDLLMVDMNMPEMSGIEVVRRVRALPNGDKLPIIMFTAETETAIKVAGFQAGVDDYLMKPTDPAELIERVQTLLGNKPVTTVESQEVSGANSDLAKSPEPVADGQLIALCGMRGGVGTTTIAINLAYMLAFMQHPTTLVDFDLRQGHIGLYLNQKIGRDLNRTATMTSDEIRNHIWEHRQAYRPNLHLLLARPNLNGRQPVPNSRQINAALETLVQRGHYIVADLGLAATKSNQLVRDRADHLILCLPPERVALAATKRYLEDIKSSLAQHTQLHVLIADMQLGVSLPQKAIEKYLHCPLLGILKIQYTELITASNKGVPLAQLFPKSATIAALYRVALKLTPVVKKAAL